MKGRKPKLNMIEGVAAGRCPSPPGGLEAHGAAEWKRVAPLLQGRGHLTDDTLATLESYCRAVGLSRIYNEMMATEGHVLATEKGLVTHPAFKMLMGTMREARLLAAELGLTPHRRGSGDGAEKPTTDKWSGDLLA
ncbi:P27 family phage terminase small subunit [Rhodobacter sp. CZR27]|uniref:P27 family phage terminase small subunit n=1 Tax=Rhodobacter sp. CZR27 TaxID=2033869 RepID=UPI0012FE57D8|nr:P27 family phage terminase small subunit [Rhodobacter sp. CZR27]